MKDPRLPKTIDRFDVNENGVLSLDGMECFPWIDEKGYLGGTVRYRLVAEGVDVKDLFQ
jgi:hypothetical protein